MDQLARWWDDAELWVAGLPFIPQVVLVLVVMVPCCFGMAWLLDGVVSIAFAMFGRAEIDDPGSSPDGPTNVEGS